MNETRNEITVDLTTNKQRVFYVLPVTHNIYACEPL